MREITGPTPTSFAGDDGILTTTTKETRQTSLPGRLSLSILNRRNGRPAFLQGQGDRARKVGANNALLILRSM
jgi:hypothetical protein